MIGSPLRTHRLHVSTLTRLIARSNGVAEPATEYDVGVEYEHCGAKHEYEHDKPEQGVGPNERSQ